MEVSKNMSKVLREGMQASAESELYYRITGDEIVYDPNDPSVEQRVKDTAQQAVRQGHYVDAKGERHSLTWDGATQARLAAQHMKRVVEE